MDGPTDDLDLTAAEVRVLGCLIEKEATTPDNYPLTQNSLRNACNQSTSRDPVVSLTDHDVERALAALRERRLTRTVHSTSNRAAKFRHVAPEVLELDEAETAALSVLMLRGAQTIGEVKGRSDRQHHFDSTDDVAAVLTSLAGRDVPLVVQLERQAGQKDARWVHLLSGAPASTATESPSTPVTAERVGSDPYGEATAEFYDLLATGMWDTFGLNLLDLLADADATAGPIIDIGTGTGVGLPYLRAAVPDAAIVAIEPSKAMRTALHTRLAMDDDLRVTTTVIPAGFERARLPERACGLVVSAALGHLNDTERRRLWTFVADRMPAGAPAVIGVVPPARAQTVPSTRYRELRVGGLTYEGWQAGEAVDDRTMRWTMTYRVLDGETLVAEHTAQSAWRCDGVDDLRTEIAEHGLALTEHQDCVVISR